MALDRRIRIGGADGWLVPYDDAESEVRLDRTLLDVLLATPGDDMRCMNSVCIGAQRNAHLFPHPVLMVSTIKTRVFIVDKLDDAGEPAHAIRYQISAADGRRIRTHDAHGAGQPGPLRLRIPVDPKGSPLRTSRSGTYRDQGAGIKKGAPKDSRPVTANHLGHVGAKARYMVAVGALQTPSEHHG